MDLVHSWGVELAVYLQTKLSGYQDVFNAASSVADLHTTFFFFFPIWFHLRRDTAIRLIWVAVLGDWLNLVLKWYGGAGGERRKAGRRESVPAYCACLPPPPGRVLFGERPYWWVQETRFYGAGPRPGLQQFPITCETGPGTLQNRVLRGEGKDSAGGERTGQNSTSANLFMERRNDYATPSEHRPELQKGTSEIPNEDFYLCGGGAGVGELPDPPGGPVMNVCLLQEAPRVTPWAPPRSGM